MLTLAVQTDYAFVTYLKNKTNSAYSPGETDEEVQYSYICRPTYIYRNDYKSTDKSKCTCQILNHLYG